MMNVTLSQYIWIGVLYSDLNVRHHRIVTTLCAMHNLVIWLQHLGLNALAGLLNIFS